MEPLQHAEVAALPGLPEDLFVERAALGVMAPLEELHVAVPRGCFGHARVVPGAPGGPDELADLQATRLGRFREEPVIELATLAHRQLKRRHALAKVRQVDLWSSLFRFACATLHGPGRVSEMDVDLCQDADPLRPGCLHHPLDCLVGKAEQIEAIRGFARGGGIAVGPINGA